MLPPFVMLQVVLNSTLKTVPLSLYVAVQTTGNLVSMKVCISFRLMPISSSVSQLCLFNSQWNYLPGGGRLLALTRQLHMQTHSLSLITVSLQLTVIVRETFLNLMVYFRLYCTCSIGLFAFVSCAINTIYHQLVYTPSLSRMAPAVFVVGGCVGWI